MSQDWSRQKEKLLQRNSDTLPARRRVINNERRRGTVLERQEMRRKRRGRKEERPKDVQYDRHAHYRRNREKVRVPLVVVRGLYKDVCAL